ncbi:MAG: sensor histidine kinase [Thermodesulfobacteriota bacterium]
MIAFRRLFRGLALDRRLAPVLTVVFFGVVVSTGVAYFYTKQNLEELALGRTEQTLGFFDREVTARVTEVLFNLRQWRQEDVFRLALESPYSYLGLSALEAAKKRLAGRIRRADHDRLLLVTPEGAIIAASKPDMEGAFTVADRDYFKRVMAGETAMETLAAGRYFNRPVMIVAAPVEGLPGTVLGVMVMAVDMDSFAEGLLRGLVKGNSDKGYILDSRGVVLASPSTSEAGKVWPKERMARVVESTASGRTVVYDGETAPRMLAAMTNATTGWYLVLEADESEVLRPAIRLAWISGGVSLGTLALVALALVALGKAMSGLRQSEEKFSRLYQNSPDSILLVDLETSRIVDVNDTFTRRTGYGREDAVGRTSRELPIYVNLEDREKFYDLLRRDGRVDNFEAEARYKGGHLAVCALSGQVVTIDNRRYLMNIIRDVTELKKMHEMMIQTEKMISVGGIAAGIAHEINNPLGIVLQATQNLAQRTRPDFRKNVEAAEKLGLDMRLVGEYMKARKLDVFIEDIQSAAARASAIIRHMLDFSRRSESRRTVCDLRAIADSAVDLASNDYDLKKSYDFKKIEIAREYDEDLPGIGCTTTEIEQVLLNVLRNAAQAMAEADPPPDRARIAIRIRNLEDRERIEIADNGPGIPEAVRRRIFEPFFTTKQPGVGTGLGLSVSYFIVTKGHGGRMSVRNSPEGGATFIIDLPKEGGLET